jgi:hypothetical protein
MKLSGEGHAVMSQKRHDEPRAKKMTKGISDLSEKVANISPVKRAFFLALVAVLSALLSTYASWNLKILLVNGTPVQPGIYFGLVLSFGVFWWITRRKSDLFTVLAVTTVAWILAHQTAYQMYEFIDGELVRIQKHVAPDYSAPIGIGPQVPYVLAMCGATGGLVGSFVTGAGISLVSKGFYGGGNWARTILIGTITGTLLESAVDAGTAPRSLPVHVGSFLPLFLVWQCSVAASIGYGLTARNESRLVDQI